MASLNIFGEPILWRHTIRSPRLSIFDARLIFLFVPLVFHFRLWTVGLLLAGVVVFAVIERAGLRFPSALRAIRSRLAGSARPAQPRAQYRAAVDFGFETHPLTAISQPGAKPSRDAKSNADARRDRRKAIASGAVQPAE